MTNPFTDRTPSLSGPATDIMPVTPDDSNDLSETAVALYIETAGTLSVVTAKGGSRTVAVAGNSILPVGVRRVHATGTTAAGIHAMVIS